jgi:hypothetical protein
MSEQELLVACLERLNRVATAYMPIGSMASNYWGLPRTTDGLDFVVRFGREDVPSIAAAFQTDYFLREDSVLAALGRRFSSTRSILVRR